MKVSQYLVCILLLPALLTSKEIAYDLSKLAQDYITKAEQAKKDNDIDLAIMHYKNAVALNPNDFMLLFNLANELYGQGHKEEAITYYDRALEIRTNVEQVYFNKGVVLTQLEQHDKAADCFMQAINTNKNYTRAYIHAGNAFEKINRHPEAIDMYQKALEIDSNNAELHHRLAVVYRHLDKFQEAIQEMRNAIAKNPNNTVYKLELANTLHLVDGSEEALALYQEILTIHPDNHHVLYNLGYTLKKLGYIDEALEIYNKVISIDSNYALARFSRSLAYLTLGQWDLGWKEYEWRWAAYNESAKKFNVPVWNGENISGKRILLYAEQGLGDTIQFIRYAKLVKDLGAYVIVETQGPLKEILKLCPYIDEVYARGEHIPYFDTHIALMSLPLVFKTDIDTTPEIVPYIYAKPELVTHWANKLKDDHNLKIGICWQGNPNYSTQFLRQAVAGKSMHVKHFEPIARLKGVTLYNIQKMGGEEQLKQLSPDINIVSFNDLDTAHGRFMDTLGLLMNLDLVITIDTGTCHVAAALGVPTWNLLPNPADWRWMLDRNDTPWYNNMRLFKQPTPGDWQGAIAECVQALQPILAGEKTVQEVTQEKGLKREMRPHQAIKAKNSKKSTALDTVQTLDKEAFIFESLEKHKTALVPYATIIQQTKPYRTPQNRDDIHHNAQQQNHNESSKEKSIPQKRTDKNSTDMRASLTSELIAVNKTLQAYDAELKKLQLSAFDETAISHTQKILQEIIEVHHKKKQLKDNIHAITTI